MEEQSYLTSLRREKDAFDKLIKEKTVSAILVKLDLHRLFIQKNFFCNRQWLFQLKWMVNVRNPQHLKLMMRM